ncbi:MAG: hypothetical protein ABR610_17650 [Thermoanaerobaculia bacterium]
MTSDVSGAPRTLVSAAPARESTVAASFLEGVVKAARSVRHGYNPSPMILLPGPETR